MTDFPRPPLDARSTDLYFHFTRANRFDPRARRANDTIDGNGRKKRHFLSLRRDEGTSGESKNARPSSEPFYYIVLNV